MVTASALVTGILTSLLIFLVCLVVYAFLARKPSFNVIYYPARLLANLPPPPDYNKQGPLTWAYLALQTSESDLVTFAGLDAAIYVRFLRTGVLITLFSMIYCMLVIVPLCATDDQFALNNKGVTDVKSQLTYTSFDTLSMGNIRKGSPRLWGCMIGVFWVSGVVYYVLYRSYTWATSVRARFQAHAVERPEQYVVLVRDIPSSKTEDDVDSFFRRLHPDSYEKCLIVRDLSKASKAYAELEKARGSLSHAEGTLRSQSGGGASSAEKRPQHKTGFFGLTGPKVDSIEYWRDQIGNELVPKLEEEQRAVGEDKSSQGSAFVFFKSRRDAALAAQAMHAQDANSWVVSEAPEAREVVFVNLHRSWYQRITLQVSSAALVTAMILFYAIPLTFISGFTTLANLQKLLPFVKDIPQSVKTILEAFLPRLAIMVFTAVLPTICIILSKLEGLPSLSQVSRAAAGKYFAFNVLNIFLIVAIGGSLFGIAKQVAKKPGEVVTLLGSSLAQNASFWVVFVALGMFAGWGFDLLGISRLVMYHLKKRLLCKTDKEVKAAWEPEQVEYHTGVPNILLVYTITLVYAVIAPMILPFGFVFFVLGYLVTVNQVMNVNVAKDFESQGRMWPHIHHRILAALFLGQVTCACYFGIKEWHYSPFLIVPPILTIIFYYYCNRKFYHSFQHLALVIAVEEAKEVPTLSQLVDSFTPPCMVPTESLKATTAVDDHTQSDALSARAYSDAEVDKGSKRSRGPYIQV